MSATPATFNIPDRKPIFLILDALQAFKDDSQCTRTEYTAAVTWVLRAETNEEST